MNKKGFTLIELIAVITLIAIVAVIATPNVVNMVDNGKKDQFVTDAKEMIAKVKYMQKLSKYEGYFSNILSNSTQNCDEIKFSLLNIELDKDADGNNYDLENSKVKVCLESNKYIYYVKTISICTNLNGENVICGRGITAISGESSYVLETEINREKVLNLVVKQ